MAKRTRRVKAVEVEEELRLRGKARKNAAIQRAIYFLSLGMAYYDVLDRLADEFGYTPRSTQLQKIAALANKEVKQKQAYYAENVAATNIARLQEMVVKCLEDNNIALANKCIETLNKTANIYNQKIEIKNGESAEFKIKLN